jgi:hypothetical protein
MFGFQKWYPSNPDKDSVERKLSHYRIPTHNNYRMLTKLGNYTVYSTKHIENITLIKSI